MPTTTDTAPPDAPSVPYARLVQPQTPSSPFTASSYVRLGKYVAGDAQEGKLVTGLTTTTSTVGEGSKGAQAQAEDAKTNAKGDPAKQYSATSQSSTSYTTTPGAAITSTNDGILIYSDTDLNENIKGAALQKFGKGHVVEVTTADAKYGVKAGKLDIGAKNGVFVKAGSFTAGAEASSSTIEQRANLEMTATGYIKQTAYGPLDEITYGTTRKNFHGDAYDEFHGFKESTFHGREHTYKMSGVMQMTLSGELVLKLSTQFALTAGIDTGIRLALDFKVFIGGKFDVVTPFDIKFVAGFSSKIGVGPDYKMMTSDMKVLTTTDMKLAPIADAKKVGINMTIAEVDVKKILISATSDMGKLYQGQMDVATANLTARQGSFSSEIRSLIVKL